MRRIVLILAILFSFCWQSGWAQTPFDTFEVSLNGSTIINDNALLQNWNPTEGISIEARSPYYTGELEAGTRFVYYRADQFEGSAFRSIYMFIGWLYSIELGERFSVTPGFRIGNHFMWQDEKKEYFGDSGGSPFVFHRNESQFAYELQVRTAYSFTERLHIHLSTSYKRSPINIPFEVAYVSVGFARTFSTPGWLRRFVR